MKISFDVGIGEKHQVEFVRDSFSGRTSIAVDGELLQLKDPWKVKTHFNLQYVNRYEFVVGRQEPHEVVVEHIRPKFMAGFFPHDYIVYLDGAILRKHHGY